jgi:hypothetical protein
MDDNYATYKQNIQQKQHESDQQYKDNSKRRLLSTIQKKFNTTIIGSLAVIEEYFGHLWGHGKDYDELTQNEQNWRKTWTTARSRILDNGNSNLRAAQNEIAQYTLRWDRYVVNLPVIKKEN